MPSRTFRVARLLLFLLGCSALLLLAGPARAEDGAGAISKATQGVTDAAAGGGRAESGGASDSNDRDGSAGRSDGGESSGDQDGNTILEGSNLADRGGDSGSNHVGSATDDASSHADDVSNQVDHATDASRHPEGGSDGASHPTESATDDASDPEENEIASARDYAEDASVKAAGATDDGTRQAREMAPDASQETLSRVVPGAPRPEQSDNAKSGESSDAGRSPSLATGSGDGEWVTEATVNATRTGGRATGVLDAPASRAAATTIQDTESLTASVTEPFESAARARDSVTETLGAGGAETTQTLTWVNEGLVLTQAHVGEALAAATAATGKVRENAAQGTGTLIESTRGHASGAIRPVAVGESLADHTGAWVNRDVNDGAAVTHSSPEGLTPAGERRALGEQARPGSAPVSAVRGTGSAEAIFAGTSEATEGRVTESEVSGAPVAPDALVVVMSRSPNSLLPAGFSSLPISGHPESGSLEPSAPAVRAGASTGGLPPLPHAPPLAPRAAAVPSTSGISASARAWGGGSNAAALIGDIAALLAPILLGMLAMRGFFARTLSLTPPAAPG